MKKLVIFTLVLFSFATAYSEVGDNWYHYEQGMRMLEARDYDQAQKEFDYYLKHSEMHRNYFGIAHFAKGLMYQQMGKYDLAISEFRMAAENDLHSEMKVTDKSYLNMGALYMKLKSYPEAIQTYSQLVRKNPRSGLAHYYLGLAHLRSGDYENAEKEAEAAKKLGVPFTALSEELTKAKGGSQEGIGKKDESIGNKPNKVAKKRAEAR